MDYFNKLLRKGGGGHNRKSDVKEISPKSSHQNGNRDREIEGEFHSSQHSTPKKQQDCDTESDTTADYESAGEASPWKEKSTNLSSLAETLARVHLSTPKETLSRLDHFPYSPISAEDEDEEVMSITSNNSQNSVTSSLSLMNEELLKNKLTNGVMNSTPHFLNSTQISSTLENEESSKMNDVNTSKSDIFKVISEPQGDLLQSSIGVKDSLNLSSIPDSKVISPFVEFEDAGPTCSFHSEIMNSIGSVNASILSNNSLIEECRHETCDILKSNQTEMTKILENEEQLSCGMKESKHILNSSQEVPVNLKRISSPKTSPNKNKNVILKHILLNEPINFILPCNNDIEIHANLQNAEESKVISNCSKDNITIPLNSASTMPIQNDVRKDIVSFSEESVQNIDEITKPVSPISTDSVKQNMPQAALQFINENQSSIQKSMPINIESIISPLKNLISSDNVVSKMKNIQNIETTIENDISSIHNFKETKQVDNSLCNNLLKSEDEESIEKSDIPNSINLPKITDNLLKSGDKESIQKSDIPNSINLPKIAHDLLKSGDKESIEKSDIPNSINLPKITNDSLICTRDEHRNDIPENIISIKSPLNVPDMGQTEVIVDNIMSTCVDLSNIKEEQSQDYIQSDNALKNISEECPTDAVIPNVINQNLSNLSDSLLRLANEKHPSCIEDSPENIKTLVSPLKILTSTDQVVNHTISDVVIETNETSNKGNLSITEMCNLIETTFNNALNENEDTGEAEQNHVVDVMCSPMPSSDISVVPHSSDGSDEKNMNNMLNEVLPEKSSGQINLLDKSLCSPMPSSDISVVPHASDGSEKIMNNMLNEMLPETSSGQINLLDKSLCSPMPSSDISVVPHASDGSEKIMNNMLNEMLPETSSGQINLLDKSLCSPMPSSDISVVPHSSDGSEKIMNNMLNEVLPETSSGQINLLDKSLCYDISDKKIALIPDQDSVITSNIEKNHVTVPKEHEESAIPIDTPQVVHEKLVGIYETSALLSLETEISNLSLDPSKSKTNNQTNVIIHNEEIKENIPTTEVDCNVMEYKIEKNERNEIASEVLPQNILASETVKLLDLSDSSVVKEPPKVDESPVLIGFEVSFEIPKTPNNSVSSPSLDSLQMKAPLMEEVHSNIVKSSAQENYTENDKTETSVIIVPTNIVEDTQNSDVRTDILTKTDVMEISPNKNGAVLSFDDCDSQIKTPDFKKEPQLSRDSPQNLGQKKRLLEYPPTMKTTLPIKVGVEEQNENQCTSLSNIVPPLENDDQSGKAAIETETLINEQTNDESLLKEPIVLSTSAESGSGYDTIISHSAIPADVNLKEESTQISAPTLPTNSDSGEREVNQKYISCPKSAKGFNQSSMIQSFQELKTCESEIPNCMSKSTIEVGSYEDLLDKCSEQERMLGFDDSIKEEAERLAKELHEASLSSTHESPKVQSNLLLTEEATKTAAEEDVCGDSFKDGLNFDFEYLSKLRGDVKKTRESLFLKFDPLASVFSPDPVQPPKRMEMTLPDSSSDATPPRVQMNNQEGLLVSITPSSSNSRHEEPTSSPSLSNNTPRARPRSVGQTPPIMRHEIVSKEINRLQQIMLKQESSYQDQMSAYSEEIDELRRKISEYENAQPIEELEENLSHARAEVTFLQETVKKQQTCKDQLLIVIGEYESTLEGIVKKREEERQAFMMEKEELITEKTTLTKHLSNMENTFNDIHKKYERSKHAIDLFMHNEREYKISLAANEQTIKQQNENYQKLKHHASEKLEQANIEISEMKKAHQIELTKLQAMNRKSEIQISTLEKSIEQKNREIAELTKICDELIKVSGA